jgi:methylated-DNA-[protein]-cysteine S-methyltransferase
MPHASVPSPIGPIQLIAQGEVLDYVRIGRHEEPPVTPDSALLREAAAQMKAYFEGRLTRFDIPLSPLKTLRGAALREALVRVPYGRIATYGEVARSAGSSPRAIGQACRRNPWPIIVPCHRIVAAGNTGNYSAGDGVVTKLWLLAHERERGE